MDKLNQLLSLNARDFAAAFTHATRTLNDEAPARGFPLWLEGWVTPARAGFVLGDGELVYEGRPCRFHFSGLPIQTGGGMRLSGAGTVSRLYRLADFSGIFLPFVPAADSGRGSAETRLKNQNGVLIELIAPDHARRFNPPDGGLRVRLAAPP